VALPRRALIGLGAVAALALGWAGLATWHLATGDQAGFYARQAELRYAYEDRIQALAGRLEREVTQNLAERSAMEARVRAVAERQAEIEARQAWMRDIAQRAGALGVAQATPSGGAHGAAGMARTFPEPGAPGKPLPLPDTLDLRLGGPADGAEKPRPSDRLSTLDAALDRVLAAETRMLDALRGATRVRLGQVRAALDLAGLDWNRPVGPAGLGGPLVPIGRAPFPGVLGAAAAEIGIGLAELDRLAPMVRAAPLGRPLAGPLEIASGFGTRIDPFTRGPALHTGLDLREEQGAPVKATGSGRVIAAEYAGGYGNMVEIDHGGGVTTRYGHLSALSVSPGERVEPGQIVGRVGSTGRSTGPHLHYETRINGEPVNPSRFLAAGRLLGA
jgi:murein DD-endopeptidase MepM/ murein hydrolase activator NlpD